MIYRLAFCLYFAYAYCHIYYALLAYILTGSGLVDISEFLTQWAALQNEPTDESNVSVDIAG